MVMSKFRGNERKRVLINIETEVSFAMGNTNNNQHESTSVCTYIIRFFVTLYVKFKKVSCD